MTAEQAANVQAYASLAGVVVTSLGLFAILAQIRTASKGSRGQNSSMFLLGDQTRTLIEGARQAVAPEFKLFSDDQMSEETAAKVLATPEMDAKLSALLNHYETIAAGIRSGSFDEDMFRFAYMRPMRLLSWQLHNFIVLIRQKARNEKIYSEMQSLAARWDRWSDAAPHFYREGKVILDVPYAELPMPTAEDRRRPRLRRR